MNDALPLFGCVHGRFQVLHIDHLDYILAAKDRCAHLIVGITNYDFRVSPADASDEHRKASENNPLTYYERTRMIRCALDAAKISGSKFSFSPFPIEFIDELPNFIGRDVVCYTTKREPWNVTKIARLESAGYDVKVLLGTTKRIASTEIRNMIAAGDERWGEWVPLGVKPYLESISIHERLRSLASGA